MKRSWDVEKRVFGIGVRLYRFGIGNLGPHPSCLHPGNPIKKNKREAHNSTTPFQNLVLEHTDP